MSNTNNNMQTQTSSALHNAIMEASGKDRHPITRHQRQYDRRVNKRQMQMQESKINMGKALDADLVVTESSGTESEVQDESNNLGNDTNTDDVDIRPIYNKEPMAKVQLIAECNIFATRQQHTEQPEIINEGRVDHVSANITIFKLNKSFGFNNDKQVT
ncbi:hypothetical protein Tco_0593743 [Tanacetum coccineum]